MNEYSVLFSLYKKEKPQHLKSAIDSMLNQTIRANQIVIVEDGPLTEELYAVLDEYEAGFPDLITRVKNPTNLGLGLALANGINYCNNQLVARMDTDDISVPDRCEQQLKLFSNNAKLDMVGGNITEFIDAESNVVAKREVPVSDCEIKEYMKKRCAFNHMTVMFKKDAVLKAGNYQDFFYNEDYFLWVRMQLGGCVFANTGTVLCNVRVGREMYKRRGGIKYFKYEKKLQKYMRKNRMIGIFTYFSNVLKRFVVQVLMPNRVREWVFKKFARKKA